MSASLETVSLKTMSIGWLVSSLGGMLVLLSSKLFIELFSLHTYLGSYFVFTVYMTIVFVIGVIIYWYLYYSFVVPFVDFLD